MTQGKSRPYTQNEISKILIDLYAKGFYGELTLKYQDGKVYFMDKRETIKPE